MEQTTIRNRTQNKPRKLSENVEIIVYATKTIIRFTTHSGTRERGERCQFAVAAVPHCK